MDTTSSWQYPPPEVEGQQASAWVGFGRGTAAGIVTGLVTGAAMFAGIITTETPLSWVQALLLYTMFAGMVGAPLGGVSGALAWALARRGVSPRGLRAAGAGIGAFWAFWAILLLQGRGAWGLAVAAALGAAWAVWVAAPALGPRDPR